MGKNSNTISFIIITIIVIVGCGKQEDPRPADNFIGIYFLQEVIEEYDPTNPNISDAEVQRNV